MSKLRFLYSCSGLLFLIVFPVDKENVLVVYSLQQLFMQLYIIIMSSTGFLLASLNNAESFSLSKCHIS